MKVDREYVEIYPLKWRHLDESCTRRILTERSNDSIPNLCIYFHVPFCTVICPFCAFNKRLFRSDLYERYVNALLSELRLYNNHPDAIGRQVHAVYFGGGTGSILLPDHVKLLLDETRAIFEFAPSVQITMECYPSTVNEERLARYLDAGINRVSIGLQTFDEDFLTLSRRADTIGILEEVSHAVRDVGFESLRIDLLYRLPGQTLNALRRDLDKFVALEPDGISTYSLELEGLPFERTVPALPDDALDKEMFYFVGEYLERHGFHRFAQPDFSKIGYEDKYVLNAWAAPQGLLLGLGAGAHTHHFGNFIYANVCSVERYINGVEGGRFPGVVGAPLNLKELQHKYMVLGVRCLRIEKNRFNEMFGVHISDVFQRQLKLAVEFGWLKDEGEVYSVSSKGLWFIDNLSKLFYSESNMGESQPRGKQITQFDKIPLVKVV